MKVNFDCTQLITYDLQKVFTDDDVKKLNNILNKEFTIISDEKVSSNKKIYFQQIRQDYIIELKNDNFNGDLTDWKCYNDITCKEISTLILFINEIIKLKIVKNLKVILVSFAEIDIHTHKKYTTDKIIRLNISDLNKGLYNMSIYALMNGYIKNRPDNLIIEILDTFY